MNTIFDSGTHKIESAGRLPTDAEAAKAWRNSELANTDWIVPTTDHPQHAAYLTYRQLLRDWTNEDTFPSIRPSI